MGEIYKAVCPKCKYETELYLGGGFLSINLRRSASILPEGEQAALLKMIDEGRISEFNIESKITECTECSKVDSQMIIDVIENDGTRHRFNGKCNTCQNDIIVHEDGADGEYMCPECRQEILELEVTGVWD